MAKELTREEWLNRAGARLKPHFKAAGFAIPANVRITCGWPSTHATSRKTLRIGECWADSASDDKSFEIFISPLLDKHEQVMATLAHELVHATVGLKAGHKAPFKKCALAIGLEGKMTATKAGAVFKQWLTDNADKLGTYPHAKLNPSAQKSSEPKQTTRMIKCTCDECGYIARTSSKWLADAGAPFCPCNGEPMSYEGGEGDE